MQQYSFWETTKETMSQRVVKPRMAPRWVGKLSRSLESRQNIVLTVAVTILLLIGLLDYLTGYELGFFIFYFVPVALTSWLAGERKGVLMACAAACCWFFSDLLTYHPYSKAYLIYWETFMRFVSFITTALSLARIREIEVYHEQVEEENALLREENKLLLQQLAMKTDKKKDDKK